MDRTIKIVKKISDFNYRIVDQNGKLQVVHVNRLKRTYYTEVWKTQVRTQDKETVKK
jgi:hypothetical protein